MSWGDKVRIETPEQIDVDLEVAGPGSRAYAQVVDWLIKFLFLLVMSVLFMCAGVGINATGVSGGVNYFLAAVAILGAFAFVFGFDAFYEGCRNGQTPGKREAGIRVVRVGGGPIDFQAACIRNLVGIADFLPTGYLLGALVMMLNEGGQRLGDMAAGTMVVRERPMEVHEALEDAILGQAGEDYVFTHDHLSRLTAQDSHILNSYFARCEDMDRLARVELATKLRGVFLERTGFVPTQPIEGIAVTEAFLAALYRDLKALRQHS